MCATATATSTRTLRSPSTVTPARSACWSCARRPRPAWRGPCLLLPREAGTGRWTDRLPGANAIVIEITPNEKGNPPGKLAKTELHFTEGPLEGLKLIGFSVWERRSGNDHNVTFPARQYVVDGERRSFALLRPAADATWPERVGEHVLQAYAEFRSAAAGHRDRGRRDARSMDFGRAASGTDAAGSPARRSAGRAAYHATPPVTAHGCYHVYCGRRRRWS